MLSYPASGQQGDVRGTGLADFDRFAGEGLIRNGDTIKVHIDGVDTDYGVMVVGNRHGGRPNYVLDSKASGFNLSPRDVLSRNTEWELLRKVQR